NSMRSGVRKNRIGQGCQVFNLVGSRADENNRHPASRGTLLVRYSLIDSQQDIVSGSFRGSGQVSILLAFHSSPLCRVRVVLGKAVPEIERQTLIQKDLHAILASRESFASSSDRTANSRVTVG